MAKNVKVKSIDRRTRHNEALAKHGLRAKLADIKRRWHQLNPVERGSQLQALLDAGCSTRGLEAELGQSDTTIRRYCSIAAMSEPLRSKVVSGRSAKRALEAQKFENRRRISKERLALDAQTGEISDSVADLVIKFSERNGLFPGDLAHMLTSAARRLVGLNTVASKMQLIPKHVDQLLDRTKPEEDPEVYFIEHWAEWLKRIMVEVAPEQAIWQRAFEKADKLYPARRRSQQTPLEMWRARMVHLAMLSTPPAPRKF